MFNSSSVSMAMALDVLVRSLMGDLFAVPADSGRNLSVLPTLEDRCFYYIIRHLAEFPSGSLGPSQLPLNIRKKLLLNLPVIDIWRLEADGVAEGLDIEGLWKTLIEERCEHVSRKHFCLPFFQKMPFRDLYFMFVWDQALQQHRPTFRRELPSVRDGYAALSKLLYNVPCVLGVEGFSMSEYNYPQSKFMLRDVVRNDPQVKDSIWHPNLIPKTEFLATIRYFGEVCHVHPRSFCFHCVTVGRHMWILAMKQSGSILQSFMADLEKVRLDGRGKLPSLEKSHRETQHERFDKIFLSIPRLFLGAAIANPRCQLKSIEIDAGDTQRAAGLLSGVQSAISTEYTKVEMFSLKFNNIYCRRSEPDNSLTFHLLSKIKLFIDTQPLLRAVTINFPEKLLPMREHLENLIRLLMEQYTEFITTIDKYIQRPHFESLILNNVLTFQTAQQIIHNFLSHSASHPQLLDIRTPDDISNQSESLLFSHCDCPAKSLKVSGMVQDDGEELLTSLVFQMLCNTNICCFEVVDTINSIVVALKQPVESLQVKNLSLTIRKVKVPSQDYETESDTVRPQYRRGGSQHFFAYERRFFQDFGAPRQVYQRQHAYREKTEELDIPQPRQFPEIPRIDKVVSNPSLLTLKICLQSPKDYVASSQVAGFLSTISDGLHSQSCSLQALVLPKLDYPVDDVQDLQHFSDSVFQLPHLEMFKLEISFITFSMQCAQSIHSSWKHHCDSSGRKLAKFVLHYDFLDGESAESLIPLMNVICNEFMCCK